MKSPKLLGIAASLRNARWGAGNRNLVDSLKQCAEKADVLAYLTRESERHVANFLEAGRREGKEFTEIYRNLNKMSGNSGLSNSEIALAAALWAAHQKGAEIDHLSLAEFFTARGEARRTDELRAALLAADGFLLSGPVYFGDRGSLAESLIDFIARDRQLLAAMKGRLYGGIAVGAKRNGGQETTLIYQMIDALGLGMLAVGNDSETTAQYGGTGHAGDVGTMHKDIYGLDTSMGVGRRMAQVLSLLGARQSLSDAPRVLFLILQDFDGIAAREVERLAAAAGSRIKPTVLDLANINIRRCIACDICPTHVDADEVYRCIIKSDGDDLGPLHSAFLEHDMLVPVVANARDRTKIAGNYQTFIERTRYLRRGDYLWSDLLTMPITYTENPATDTYPIRMMTSFLRHHTVMSRPNVGLLRDGVVQNGEEIAATLFDAIWTASRLAAGKLACGADPTHRYNPVGYVLSAAKDAEDQGLMRRRVIVDGRVRKLRKEAESRLAKHAAASD